MDIVYFRDYCLAKPGTTEDMPFDNKVLVFKVMDKMYALTDVDLFTSINLKCDPSKALELRDRFDGINAGYHMNKKHWNTVECDGSVPDNLIKELTDHSYDLVVSKLTKKKKEELKRLS